MRTDKKVSIKKVKNLAKKKMVTKPETMPLKSKPRMVETKPVRGKKKIAPKLEMREKKKKVDRGHSTKAAHVDNVKGTVIQRAKAAAHFPVDQDDVRLMRTKYMNALHEKARQGKSQVAMEMGKLIFADPIKTMFGNFDPANLTSGIARKLHRMGRTRSDGVDSMEPAMNEVEINMRSGGGADVAKDPLGKVRGLQ